MTDLATDRRGTRDHPNCEPAGRLVPVHEVPADRAVLEALGAGPDEG